MRIQPDIGKRMMGLNMCNKLKVEKLTVLKKKTTCKNNRIQLTNDRN